jgi:hypothetical protein
MNTRLLVTGIAAMALALLLPVTLVAPAQAEREVRRDQVGDSVGYDIKKLVVDHGRKVRLTVRFDDRTPYFTYLRVDVPRTAKNWKFLVTWAAYWPNKAWVDVRTNDGLKDRCKVRAREVEGKTVVIKVPRHCLKVKDRKPARVKARAYAEDDQFCPCPRDTTRWTEWARRW